ncbi:MAG TPA: TIGR03960 family B12-binding radical SAM protein [Thermodesulfobacteriota bacterium]|nr:TIGR03960 family B12-binding radical SAM protein [Thermodesulfobacteriota bacterium]
MTAWKLVQKAKDILAKERGTIQKEWGGKITICLLYPNAYHVGMSNLGFQTLYQILNAQEDVVCERAFLPGPEDVETYRNTQTPLFSLESQKPLSRFDFLAFSISFENDFLNVLTLLELAHLPLESRLRKGRDPWVIGGGVAVFLNPEPLSDFLDLFILGEAEEVIGEFLDVCRQTLSDQEKGERDRFLANFSNVEGVYIPRFYGVVYSGDGKIAEMDPEPGFPRKVKRRWISRLDQYPTQSALFTPDTEFSGMALVEVNRGCPRGCRFCAACFVYHPFRNRSLSLLESTSKEALLKEHRIGLTGTAVSDHPQLLPLCQSILSRQGEISLSSLRVDAVNPPLVQCLREGEERTVAIAPEAGSKRLRRMLKKGYEEEEILKSIDTLVENGVSQIKCYFLIGLPTETDEDTREILRLAKRIRHCILSRQKDRGKRWRLVLSVNPFIPKPATPFQWAPLEEVGELKRRLKIIQRGIQREGGMVMIHDLPKWAYVQALLSRGDRRVGKILTACHRHHGNWSQAFRETDINPDFYVYRTRDLDEIFPWDFIDHGIPKERLREEYARAMKEAGSTTED